MKTWNNFLDEKENQHDFSSTQINLPKTLANEIIAWGREYIPDSFLYNKQESRELEIHVTVLYGLRDEDPDKVKEILETERPVKFKLGKISAFDTNEEYDVIKIEVISPNLHKLNKLLKVLPHQDSHPRYNPHVTIEGEIISAKEVIFSSYNGQKTEIELKK